MVYCCSWGLCKSSSRKSEPDVRFVRFPNVNKQRKRAEKWAFLCGRKGFTIKNVSKFRYICSKHFPPNSILDPKLNPFLEPFDAVREYKAQQKEENNKNRKPPARRQSAQSSLEDTKNLMDFQDCAVNSMVQYVTQWSCLNLAQRKSV